MGSKRIGLARTQALIENLKRELDLNGATLKDLNVQTGVDGLVEANTASKAVSAADSGKWKYEVTEADASRINAKPEDWDRLVHGTDEYGQRYEV